MYLPIRLTQRTDSGYTTTASGSSVNYSENKIKKLDQRDDAKKFVGSVSQRHHSKLDVCQVAVDEKRQQNYQQVTTPQSAQRCLNVNGLYNSQNYNHYSLARSNSEATYTSCQTKSDYDNWANRMNSQYTSSCNVRSKPPIPIGTTNYPNPGTTVCRFPVFNPPQQVSRNASVSKTSSHRSSIAQNHNHHPNQNQHQNRISYYQMANGPYQNQNQNPNHNYIDNETESHLVESHVGSICNYPISGSQINSEVHNYGPHYSNSLMRKTSLGSARPPANYSNNYHQNLMATSAMASNQNHMDPIQYAHSSVATPNHLMTNLQPSCSSIDLDLSMIHQEVLNQNESGINHGFHQHQHHHNHHHHQQNFSRKSNRSIKSIMSQINQMDRNLDDIYNNSPTNSPRNSTRIDRSNSHLSQSNVVLPVIAQNFTPVPGATDLPENYNDETDSQPIYDSVTGLGLRDQLNENQDQDNECNQDQGFNIVPEQLHEPRTSVKSASGTKSIKSYTITNQRNSVSITESRTPITTRYKPTKILTEKPRVSQLSSVGIPCNISELPANTQSKLSLESSRKRRSDSIPVINKKSNVAENSDNELSSTMPKFAPESVVRKLSFVKTKSVSNNESRNIHVKHRRQ